MAAQGPKKPKPNPHHTPAQALKILLELVVREHQRSINSILQELVHMASSVTPEQVDQALDTLQGTIDMTQSNVEALLTLIRANPNDPQLLGRIKDKLEAMNVDLSGTNFDPNAQPPTG